jgi:hypothetical protein
VLEADCFAPIFRWALHQSAARFAVHRSIFVSIEIRLPDKEIFTVKEIAAVLDIHIATAWRYLERGVRGQRLPSFRIGPKRRRVGRRALLEWLEAINADDLISEPEDRRAHQARQEREARQVEQALIVEGF